MLTHLTLQSFKGCVCLFLPLLFFFTCLDFFSHTCNRTYSTIFYFSSFSFVNAWVHYGIFFGIFKISLKMTSNEESSHSLIFLFSLSQIHVLGIVGMIICDFLRLHSLNLALVNFRNPLKGMEIISFLQLFQATLHRLHTHWHLLCLFSYFSSKDGVRHIRLSRTFCHFLSHGFLLSSTLPVNLEPLH